MIVLVVAQGDDDTHQTIYVHRESLIAQMTQSRQAASQQHQQAAMVWGGWEHPGHCCPLLMVQLSSTAVLKATACFARRACTTAHCSQAIKKTAKDKQ
jgi:hypothetical protein